jgi:hypothetical protein
MLYEGHNHHNLLESTWYALVHLLCCRRISIQQHNSPAQRLSLGSAGLQSLQGIAGRQVQMVQDAEEASGLWLIYG